jgi:hypothetical protein
VYHHGIAAEQRRGYLYLHVHIWNTSTDRGCSKPERGKLYERAWLGAAVALGLLIFHLGSLNSDKICMGQGLTHARTTQKSPLAFACEILALLPTSAPVFRPQQWFLYSTGLYEFKFKFEYLENQHRQPPQSIPGCRCENGLI